MAVYAFPSRESEGLIPFLDQPESSSKRVLLDWTELIFIIILQISMFISVFSVFVHENVR